MGDFIAGVADRLCRPVGLLSTGSGVAFCVVDIASILFHVGGARPTPGMGVLLVTVGLIAMRQRD